MPKIAYYIYMINQFSQRLRESLRQNGISQSELARKIKMSQGVVNNYCTGKREPTLDVVILISKALDETTDFLLGADTYTP